MPPHNLQLGAKLRVVVSERRSRVGRGKCPDLLLLLASNVTIPYRQTCTGLSTHTHPPARLSELFLHQSGRNLHSK